MTTLLSTRTRPFVHFDPNDKEHRKALADFMKNGNWKGCPFQFVNIDQPGETLSVVFAKTLKYYCAKEFGNK